MDDAERLIYAKIASSDGVKAREIARDLGLERGTVNHYLYTSPYMRELCVKDAEDAWHGLIAQARPHRGLGDFCGWYGTVREFLEEDEETWFEELLAGCGRIGRGLSDARGLFHSFRDAREVMAGLFADLSDMGLPPERSGDWEICFEVRIKKGRHIRIYADVLLITERTVFSLEFKMKDEILPEEAAQAAKYQPYLEVVFGPGTDVVSALVLTKAEDLYTQTPLPGTSGIVPVCSGDLLFDLLDDYLGILPR